MFSATTPLALQNLSVAQLASLSSDQLIDQMNSLSNMLLRVEKRARQEEAQNKAKDAEEYEAALQISADYGRFQAGFIEEITAENIELKRALADTEQTLQDTRHMQEQMQLQMQERTRQLQDRERDLLATEEERNAAWATFQNGQVRALKRARRGWAHLRAESVPRRARRVLRTVTHALNEGDAAAATRAIETAMCALLKANAVAI